jgi:hypothetical protein
MKPSYHPMLAQASMGAPAKGSWESYHWTYAVLKIPDKMGLR